MMKEIPMQTQAKRRGGGELRVLFVPFDYYLIPNLKLQSSEQQSNDTEI